jgi:exodeoxyribonuclease V alpha subunit
MEIEGKVVQIKTYNRESRWGKLQLHDKTLGPVNVVGIIPDNVIEGRFFKITGDDEEHPKYGYQVRMDEIEEIEIGEQTQEDGLSFLKHFKGIGPATATRIWETWGESAEDILRNETWRLKEIPGISQRKALEIEDQVSDMGRDGDLIALIVKHRLPMRHLESLKRRFGRRAVEILTRGAYELMKIRGIGFITADRIGQRQGFAWDSVERIKAGILYTLDNSLDGSMYTDSIDLLGDTRRLLKGGGEGRSVPIAKVNRELERLVAASEIVCERPDEVIPRETIEDDCYSHANHRIETGVARRVFEMSRKPIHQLPVVSPMWDQLAPDQKAAVEMCLQERISLIVGPAGSGKTTVLKEILAQTAAEGPLVVCFTGRAAQRVQEISGFANCSTIHRALKYRPGAGFAHDETNPLLEDVMLVDEASMIGLDLTLSLLKGASANRQRIVFTGDPSQLPSISNGNLLCELANCGIIPSTTLQYVYRNANTILDNANRIRVGNSALVYDPTFRFHPENDPRTVLNRYYTDPATTLVLSGCKEGDRGVKELNRWLQWQQGIQGAVKIGSDYTVNVGDKVIHTKNNYKKQVFNGNIGWVTKVTAVPGKDPEIEVEFREGLTPQTIVYSGKTELDELDLAYCLTVHKSQGAEAKTVFLVLDPGHFPVQSRNWLYTGVTRAQKQVHLVGSERVAYRCIESQDVSEARMSKLGLRLQSLHSQAMAAEAEDDEQRSA